MEPTSAEALVLVADPGPEATAAVLVFAVALIGAVVGVLMARRGRVEGWSLVGVFGLVMLLSLVALAHLPTRLVFDRTGAEVSFWGFGERRSWREISSVQVQPSLLGTFVSVRKVSAGPSALWSRWPGLLAPGPGPEPRQIAMRIEAWRLAAER